MLNKILKLKKLNVKYLLIPNITNELDIEQNNDSLGFINYRGEEIKEEILEIKNISLEN